MKFSIANANLIPPVTALRGLHGGVRGTLPTANFFLIEVAGNEGTFIASNAEIEMVCRVADLEVEGEGKALIPGDKLRSIVSNSSENETISFNCDENQAEIHAGRSRFKLGALPPDHFPRMEGANEEGAQLDIRAEDLHFLIDKTAFSMAQNDARYYLNGMLLSSQGDHLLTVATDGHRLAVCEIQHASGGEDETKVILPRRAVLELKRILPQSESTVSICIGKTAVRIDFGDTTMTMKLLEGTKYPDYKRVMPSDFAHTVSLNTEDFKQTLAKAQVVDAGATRLSFTQNSLKLVARSDQDEAEIEQGVEYSGEDFELGLNPQYLAEVLSVIDSEKVLLELKDPNSAVQIRESDSKTAKYVVMPLRL